MRWTLSSLMARAPFSASEKIRPPAPTAHHRKFPSPSTANCAVSAADILLSKESTGPTDETARNFSGIVLSAARP